MSIRLSDEQHARLRKEAYEQQMSMNDLIINALAHEFKGWDRDDSGPWPVSRSATRSARATGVVA